MLPLVNLSSGLRVARLVCCELIAGFSLAAMARSSREMGLLVVRRGACVIDMLSSEWEVMRRRGIWLDGWLRSVGWSWLFGWSSSISSSLVG